MLAPSPARPGPAAVLFGPGATTPSARVFREVRGASGTVLVVLGDGPPRALPASGPGALALADVLVREAVGEGAPWGLLLVVADEVVARRPAGPLDLREEELLGFLRAHAHLLAAWR